MTDQKIEDVKNEDYALFKVSYPLSPLTKRNRAARETLAAILGGKCAHCGYIERKLREYDRVFHDEVRLEFDHIDPKTKLFTVSAKFVWFDPEQPLIVEESDRPRTKHQKLLVEVFKCQLLCEPCHNIKSKNEK